MSKRKVADKDYFIGTDGEVSESETPGATVLVRKGQEVTTVMTREHGIDGVDEDGDGTDAENKPADEEDAEHKPAADTSDVKIDAGGSENK